MRAIFGVLLSCSALLASDPSIVGETKVGPYRLVRLAVKDAPAKSGVLWRVRGAGPIDYAGPRNKLDLAFVAPPGAYTAEAAIVTIGPGGVPSLDAIETTVTIGGTSPAPTPTPTPSPPGPDARTNPFSDDAARVLFLWNPEGEPLTDEQTTTMYGAETRKAMQDFGPLRVLTIKSQPSEKVLADAVAKGGKSYPWYMVGKGGKGFEGPVRGPKEFLSLLDELRDKPSASAEIPPTWGAGGVQFQQGCRMVLVNGQWTRVCP